ncbi:MAG: PEP-CTERM sorting domain-containing protein [Opitutales bacterium]|nr:PEP-CTERM sorting domain-containing protein [Opitutales bacterium]
MKPIKILGILAAASCGLAPFGQAQIILAEYNMDSLAASASDVSVSAGDLTAADNLAVLSTGNPGPDGGVYDDDILQAGVGTDHVYNTSAAAFENLAYFSYTLTVDSVDPVSFENISFQATRGGDNPGRGFGLRVIDPLGTAIDIAEDVPLTTPRGTFSDFDYDLSSIASLQNVASGESITFQMAVVMNSSFGSATRSIDVDNIQVTGIPEPSAYAALAGLLGLLIVARRRLRAA